MLAKDQEKRLANYLSHGISHGVACNAVGCRLDELQELLLQPEFLMAIDGFEASRKTNDLDVDDVYDRVELIAVQNLEKALKISYDPELALRVAMVANRAKRRRSEFVPTNEPLQPGGKQAVHLNLCVNFVQQIQNNGLAPNAVKPVMEDGKKFNQVDYATPQQVESLVHTLGGFTPTILSAKSKQTKRLMFDLEPDLDDQVDDE